MRQFNDPPEDLTTWMRVGLRRVVALEWRRWRFSLEEATAWRDAGVTVALTAAQWRTASATPDTVGEWRKAGVGPSEAVRWHEFGCNLERVRTLKAEGAAPDDVLTPHTPSKVHTESSELQRAYHRFHVAGVQGAIVHGYLSSNWCSDTALAWARHQIPAEDAQTWASLALHPVEAAELIEAGRTPGEVVAEWWGAHIPFDEVADWIGAGLSAAEAVAQRDAGVTVEAAATLRALRYTGRRPLSK